MRIAFGVDEAHPISDHLRDHLAARHQLTLIVENEPWPAVGHAVGRAVAEGRAERGVVLCWTGTGVSIAANKVPGVRAALCGDTQTAVGARRWNDANVIALGLQSATPSTAVEIVEAFLSADVDDEELATIATVEPAP